MVDKIKRNIVEDNAVTEPKIAAGAVDATALNTTAITGLSELTSVADNDKLIISDTSAGTLKKVDKSNTTGFNFPTISSISPDNVQTVDGGDITFTITGTGFTTGTNARLISNTGARLNFSSVTRTSTTSITATVARSSFLLAQTPYDIQVINGEGLSVVSQNQIAVDTTPVFVTSAGSLGTFTEGDSIDITVEARDPDSSSAVTFELQSGSLPAGLSLVNQSGDSCRITGTASAVSSDTTSNFTLRAFDSASNTVSRSFSITIQDFTMNGLRFDSASGDYLNRTPSSASNRRTFTISTWAKLCKFDTTGYTIIGAGNTITGEDGEWVLKIDNFGRDGQLIVQTGPTVILETTQALRDPSAWYHIVIAVDTTSATSGDRVRMYINGSEVTAFDVENQPTQNQDFAVNNNVVHEIGRFPRITSQNFDGYLSEFHLIDGSQLTPSSFGETDSNGVWIPKNYSGSYGTNGFHLDFADASDLGDDESGNTNDFTEQAITSIDKSEDTPQNNYATLNPLNNVGTGTNPTYSEGNLKVVTPGASNSYFGGSGNIGITTGKWYIEVELDAQSSSGQGVIGMSTNIFEEARQNRHFGQLTSNPSVGYYGSNGNKVVDGGTDASYGNSYTTGDIIGIAIDLDNNYIYFSKNGTFQNSGDPTSGSSGTGGIALTSTDREWFLSLGDAGSTTNATYLINYGSPPFSITSGNSDGNGYGNFEYAVPSGFYALNTKNLAQYG